MIILITGLWWKYSFSEFKHEQNLVKQKVLNQAYISKEACRLSSCPNGSNLISIQSLSSLDYNVKRGYQFQYFCKKVMTKIVQGV